MRRRKHKMHGQQKHHTEQIYHEPEALRSETILGARVFDQGLGFRLFKSPYPNPQRPETIKLERTLNSLKLAKKRPQPYSKLNPKLHVRLQVRGGLARPRRTSARQQNRAERGTYFFFFFLTSLAFGVGGFGVWCWGFRVWSFRFRARCLKGLGFKFQV